MTEAQMTTLIQETLSNPESVVDTHYFQQNGWLVVSLTFYKVEANIDQADVEEFEDFEDCYDEITGEVYVDVDHEYKGEDFGLIRIENTLYLAKLVE